MESGRFFTFFWAPIDGTIQLFKVTYPGLTKMMPIITQVTKGDFDITGIVGQSGNTMIVSRTDMNHPTELYVVDLTNGALKQLTHVNDEVLKTTGICKTERRFVTTTDNKKMLVWVIYPPGFDASKKYPDAALLPGRAAIAFDSDVFVPLEFSVDGVAGLHRRGTKSPGDAGSRNAVERAN
jgi:dipeptidyl aminopeptidase/acylaminoacyl peptidase